MNIQGDSSSYEKLPKIPPYHFQDKNGHLNWSNISNIDINSIQRIDDLEIYQGNIQELVFAQLSKDDNSKLGNVNTINLFKLSQISVEYLLHVQDSLESISKEIDEEYLNTQNKYIEIKNRAKKQKEYLSKYKQEYNEKKQSILVCNELMGESDKYNCEICKGKDFNSKKELIAHYSKKHPSVKVSPSKLLPKERHKMAFSEPKTEEDKENELKDKLTKNEDKFVTALKCFHKNYASVEISEPINLNKEESKEIKRISETENNIEFSLEKDEMEKQSLSKVRGTCPALSSRGLEGAAADLAEPAKLFLIDSPAPSASPHCTG